MLRFALSLAVATLAAGTLSAEVMHEGPSVSIPADQVTFGATGIATDAGELLAGPVFGDLAHGKHGTFIRMPAGFVSPEHTHTEDYLAVVLRGTGANGLPGAVDLPLPSGSYWFQRGEEAHVTKCLSTEECLFFLYQPGAFDYLPVK
jgi:beta-alanine degradation protein BauB